MNTFTLVFTSDELNVIFNALQDKPYKEAAPVIDSIRMQIQAAQEEQMKKATEAAEAAKSEKGDTE